MAERTPQDPADRPDWLDDTVPADETPTVLEPAPGTDYPAAGDEYPAHDAVASASGPQSAGLHPVPDDAAAGPAAAADPAYGATAEAPAQRTAREPRRPRGKWQLLAITALGLAGALVLGWFTGILAGKAFGPEQPAPRTTAASSAEATATGEGSTPGESIKIAAATLLDPPPGDGQENPDRINLSYDGQPGTTWPTLQYKGNETFGNIKPGVGIVYDLGEEKTVSKVRITTTIPGSSVEIRTGATPTGTLDQYPVVAGAKLEQTSEIPLPAGVKTRYLVVWITKLVQQQGFYQASLSEVEIIS